jgi:hypothetical protein
MEKQTTNVITDIFAVVYVGYIYVQQTSGSLIASVNAILNEGPNHSILLRG